MNRRPVCLLCIGLMIILWILKAAGAPVFGEPAFPEEIRKKLEDGCVTKVTGEVVSRRKGDRSIQYILNNSTATVCGKKIHISKLNMTMSADAGFSDDLRTEPKTLLSLGSKIRATGNLRLIAPPSNPGEFDRKTYFAAQNIFLSIYADDVQVETEGGGLTERMQCLRETMTERLTELMHPEQAGVLSAMLLGDRSLLPEEVKTNYSYGGVMHILAISGLHIVMLGMLLYGALERLFLWRTSVAFRRKGKRIAALLSWLVMGLYTVFAGMPIPAVRAWIMYGIMLLAEAAEKSYDPVCALSVAAIILLLSNPNCLFYEGFQLSFAAVAGISVIYPALLSCVSTSFWRKGSKKKRLLEKLIEAFLAYLAVSLATLPLVAWYFFQIPLWSFAVNLLLVPAMTVVMALGTAGLSLAMVSPVLGRLLLVPVDLILQLYTVVTGLVRWLPSSMWICGRPDFRQLVFYYLLLFGWVFYRNLIAGRNMESGEDGSSGRVADDGRKGWISRLVKKNGVEGIVFLLLIFFFAFRPSPSFSVTMLDVGQGDCCLIRTEEGAAFMVDGGSSNVKQVGTYRIIPYLKEQGIGYLDGIFISHGDEDHVGGVEELLLAIQERTTSIRVGRLWMPAWMKGDEKGQRLAAECREAGIPVSYVAGGKTVISGKTKIRVLHPFATGGEQEGNAGSMVLEVCHGKFRGLFTGDLEREGEKEVLPYIRKVSLLKVAHHGSAYSTSEEFLARTGRPVSLISAPKHSRYHHPHRETLQRLQKAGIRYFCTKDCGAIRAIPRGKKLEIREYLRGDGF